MPEIEVEGRRVAYRDAGPGSGPGAPVLFAHCSLAHSGLWKPMLTALAPRRRALAVDMPAHGGTAPPADGESLQQFGARACIALLETLGRKAHLAGLSLGGAVLGRVAVARPDLVASLTLIEPVYFHLLRPAGRIAEADEDEALMSEVARLFDAGERIAAVKRFMTVWGAPGGVEAMSDEGLAYAVRCYGELARDWQSVIGHPPGQITPADLAALPMPVLLMQGADTPRAAAAILDVVQAALPEARRLAIPGAGHLAPVTHWRETLDELERFFAEVDRRAPAPAA